MKRFWPRTFRAQLLVTYFLLIVISLGGLTFWFAPHFRKEAEEQAEHDLELQAYLLAANLHEFFKEEGERIDQQSLQVFLADYAQKIGSRVVVVDGNYRVLAATDPLVPAALPPDLPELRAAVAGKEQHDIRIDAIDQARRMFVAAPIWHENDLVGLVQVSVPMHPVDEAVRRSLQTLALSVCGILIVTIVVSLGMAQQVSAPLAALEMAVHRLGKDDWRQVVPSGPQELRSLAERYNEMVLYLKDLLERQKMFTANAAHELRSPLTALRLRMEMIQQNPDDRELADFYLSDMLLEVEHLQRMVDQLLELAAADIRPRKPASWVDLAPLLYRVSDEMAPVFDVHQVRLLLDVPTHLPPLLVWPLDIEIILRNLLDNAVKYTPAGGEVWLTAHALHQQVVIKVSDTGQGIAAEDQKHVFERFFIRDEHRRGVGLGLALVYELVSRNGGEIDLQSTVGVGTTFQIIFPIKERNVS